MRRTNRTEVITAILLSLATVVTAWCGYQSARWSGEQTRAYNQATAARVTTARIEGRALIQDDLNVGLFVPYITAIARNETELTDFLYQRFPPALKAATDAWLATNPLENPQAPLSPFDMPEYQLEDTADIEKFEQLTVEKFSEANAANETADNYVLLTVIFAMVLFFTGISSNFQPGVVQNMMVILASLSFVVGLGFLMRLPVH